MNSLFVRMVALVLSALPVLACSSSEGPSLNPDKSNCDAVCTKAHDCIDSTLDTSKCTSDCNTKADDGVFAAKVKECAECAEPKACSEVSGCTGDCLRVYLP